MIIWPVEVADSKYLRWYVRLMQTAKARTPLTGYVEEHHILPRSMGGGNDKENLVRLSAREHYIAHLLLWKSKFPQPYHKKMVFAANAMSNKVSFNKKRTYKVNSRIYNSLRNDYSVHMSVEMTGEGNHFYGRTHSEESMKKMLAYHRAPATRLAKSERVKGDLNPAKDPEVRKLIGVKQRERLAKQKELGVGNYDPELLAYRKILSGGASNGNAKLFKFTDPAGNTTLVKGGFKKFCINNKLRHNSMVEIVKSRRKSYHGWTVEYVKE
jgi:hypothetical protein